MYPFLYCLLSEVTLDKYTLVKENRRLFLDIVKSLELDQQDSDMSLKMIYEVFNKSPETAVRLQ